jgi:hypothetical protein
METDFAVNTLDYPGARAVAFMAKTLRALEWWRLEAHPELIQESPSPFCAAELGRTYVAYLRHGGVLKVDLRGANEIESFHVRWVDLAEEREAPAREVSGGGIRVLNPPVDDLGARQAKEYVLILSRDR